MSSTAALPSSDFLVATRDTSPTLARRWAGRLLTAIPVAFLLMDSVIKLMRMAPVIESFAHLGYAPELAAVIGAVELLCIALYLVPRTSIAGAVLLTGFLGGAVASHVRVADPLLTHALFPVYVAVLLWAGLYLRDRRVRQLLQSTI